MAAKQEFTTNAARLYHISEEPGIEVFEPKPSPSHYDGIAGDVVFAISEEMVHNYLLPRDCPRVTYYLSLDTTAADREKFLGSTKARYVIIVESAWYARINEAVLYCYEFSSGGFTLLDECAGYYISSKPVIPLFVKPVANLIAQLLNRNVELRFTPSLKQIADEVKLSSLNFSIIRLRNSR